MKIIFYYILVISLILGLTACSNSTNNNSSENETERENSLLIDDTEEEWEDPLVIDDTSDYTVSSLYLESSKAQKSKFEVEMYIELGNTDENGNYTGEKTTTLPMNFDKYTSVTLVIENNNDEIFICCSGFWRVEKLINGEYKEVKDFKSKYEANNKFGPGSEGYVGCSLEEYSDLISEGKYRFISPTLHIAKETEDGLEDYTYQNEKAFILYSEFEFVK